MDATEIHRRLAAKIGSAIGALTTENPDPYIMVDKAAIATVGRFLKEEPDLAFDFLESIAGVDHGDKLQLVYHLFSYQHRHAIVLKLEMPYDDVEVPSCAAVWRAADWHEREQYDLFGFAFAGHPDLRRIMLPEDWVGHPLRKAYEDPVSYHGIEHNRPNPLDQLKALDDLKRKAAGKSKAGDA